MVCEQSWFSFRCLSSPSNPTSTFHSRLLHDNLSRLEKETLAWQNLQETVNSHETVLNVLTLQPRVPVPVQFPPVILQEPTISRRTMFLPTNHYTPSGVEPPLSRTSWLGDIYDLTKLVEEFRGDSSMAVISKGDSLDLVVWLFS